MLESTAIFSDGENQVTATAVVGIDLSQKGMQTSQQFGAASTYGKKYALGNLFLIDDTEDADATNTHGKADVKPRITVEQFNKAKEYITNGGNVNAIKTKYKLTSKQEEELTKL